MSLFRQLTEKPWETSRGEVDDSHEGTTFSLPQMTLGLRFFLAVVTVIPFGVGPDLNLLARIGPAILWSTVR